MLLNKVQYEYYISYTKVKPINLASTYMYPFGVRHAKCYPENVGTYWPDLWA